MDMNQYLQIFIEESEENLQSLNEQLLKLEENPESKEIVNEIFRAAHTLKGMSGSMGFINMQDLTHKMENVLDEVRNDNIKVNSSMLNTLFKGLDAIESYIEEIKASATEGDKKYNEITDELKKILNPELEAEEQSSGTVNQTEVPEEVISMIEMAKSSDINAIEANIRISVNCTLKAARMFILFRELEGKAEVIHSVPSVQAIEDEEFEQEVKLVLLTALGANEIKQIIEQVGEIDEVSVNDNPNLGNANTQKENQPALEESKQQDTKETKKEIVKKQAIKSSKSVRVNIDRLDMLMNLVSELIIVKTQLQEYATKESSGIYNESVEYLERITSNLHESVMKVRMVPVESVFNRFPRMLRDVAHKLNKEIELVISGQETELDRVVIDEIGDPLIHLLRNAADHGLESSDERERIGKIRKGTIYLRAYQQGNNVMIEVEDDGYGIDANKLREKFISKGRITEDEASKMTDKEAIELLFKPNFSTAEEVTDLSGRGVGLDVVKIKITSLGGEVEIDTKVGSGSKFIIKLPLTLAIIEALLVKIGQEKYAIPLEYVQNIEEIEESSFKEIKNKKVIMKENEVIPLKDVKGMLDIEQTQAQEETNLCVIVKKGSKQMIFKVEELISQQEIVVKSLGTYLNRTKFVSGATILGNGEIALILDINNLIHHKGE